MLKVKMPLKATRAVDTKVDGSNQIKKEPPKLTVKVAPRRIPNRATWYDNLPSFSEVQQFFNVNFGNFGFSREPKGQKAEKQSKIKINSSSRLAPKKQANSD
jgi:hypothetical protein